MTLWAGGRIVDETMPVLRADDHGVTVGDGVFETVKVMNGQPFALTRHLRRLQRSAQGLGLPVDVAAVRDAVAAVCEADSRQQGGGHRRLRITLTGGPAPYGSDRGDSSPTLLIASAPLPEWPASSKVVVAPWARNERSAIAGLKTTSYAENVVALAYAHRHGGTEAVFGNGRGELCEGSGTNVFVAVGGQLLTPPLASGCLAGVTRELLLEWVDGIAERPLPLEILQTADEVFLTSSTRDVHPVHAVDDRILDPVPGPLTRKAMTAFAARAAEDPDP